MTDKFVFFNEAWVPYDQRHNWLLDADCGVTTHFEHVETTFAFRTRVLDYLWAGLPIVTTDGDAFADLVRTERLGVVAKCAPPLRGAVETDLLGIGGGDTGLWTAVQAKEDVPARAVVLVEARTCVWAARGRHGDAALAGQVLARDRLLVAQEGLEGARVHDLAAVLAEILKQRRYELFLQGLRFDDLRRFNATRKYDFLPLPQSECDRNPAAPC